MSMLCSLFYCSVVFYMICWLLCSGALSGVNESNVKPSMDESTSALDVATEKKIVGEIKGAPGEEIWTGDVSRKVFVE